MDTSKQNMLHAHTMQPTLFPFAVFLMLTISAFAQNGIFIDSNTYATSTITRNRPTGNRLIHYVKTSDTTGKFLYGYNYVFVLPPYATYNEIPISGYDVRDFTVVNDTVYMCGNEANGRGFYGWMKLGPSPTSVQLRIYNLYDDSSYVTNPRRIHVFYNLNNPQIVLVGDYVCPGCSSGIPSIIHVGFVYKRVAYGNGEHFDDVAVLDNYVVTVSRKDYNNPNNASQFMHVLPKNAFSLTNSLFSNQYAIDPHLAGERVLLQHVGGDNLVSVCQDGTKYYINCFTVDNSGILHLNRRYSVDTVVNHINDVSYNQADSSLMVIHSIPSHSTASRFSCASFPNISWIESYCPNVSGYCSGCQPLIMSMARTNSSKFMVSGILNNHFMVWNTNGNCNDGSRIDISQYFSRLPYIVRNMPTKIIGLNSLTSTRTIHTTYVYEICY